MAWLRWVWAAKSPAGEEERLSADKKIFIKDGEKCHFVPISKIFLLESEGNYVRVHYEKHKPLLHKSLTYLEQKLPEDLFFRANRQYMFNLDYVEAIEPYFNSTLLIILRSGHKIDLSQRQSAKFREITGVWGGEAAPQPSSGLQLLKIESTPRWGIITIYSTGKSTFYFLCSKLLLFHKPH